MTMDRRTVLSALALLAVPGAAGAAVPAGGLADVVVDTRPIAARGNTAFARRVAVVASPAAREAMATRISGTRGAPTLMLSLSSLQLDSAGGMSGRHGVSSGSLDWIEGDAVLVDPRGKELARRHIVTSNAPTFGDRPDILTAEDFRIGAIVAVFARFAVAELGV